MKIIKFKFGSRKNIYGKSYTNGVDLLGWAYFVINDSGIIIAQIPQIIRGEYRRTDSDMIITEGYWKKTEIKTFRHTFLPEEESHKYTKKFPRKTLTQKQIVSINAEFRKNKFSFLTALSLLSGSNISGCQTNKLRQPYFYIGSGIEDEWTLFNPINCFKPIRKINHQLEIKFDENHQYLTLREYFTLFKNIIVKKINYDPERLFIEWNKLRKIMMENSHKIINGIDFTIDESKTKIKKYGLSLDDYFEDAEERLRLYVNGEFAYDDKKLKNFIRTKFTVLCNLAIANGVLSPSSFENDSAALCENSHIIPMQYLLQSKTNLQNLIDAISPYNCLRLSPTLHTAYDKNKITFTSEGKIEGVNIEKDYISKDIQNHETRKKYVEKNYYNWLHYKKNIQ